MRERVEETHIEREIENERRIREREREAESIAEAVPPNTCNAYIQQQEKKETKKIHREPKWCGRESSKVALSLAVACQRKHPGE